MALKIFDRRVPIFVQALMTKLFIESSNMFNFAAVYHVSML